MIERKMAEHIKEVALSCVSQLDKSVKDAIDSAPEEQASMYRRLVGKVMGHIFMEVLTPIYIAHPDLEPESVKKARNKEVAMAMPLETGIKLMKTSSSALATLTSLQQELAQTAEEDARAIRSTLQDSFELIQDIQEFLRRVCPGVDSK